MSIQQQQPRGGSKQNKDMHRKKSDDDMESSRMESEGEAAGAAAIRKDRKANDEACKT